MKAPRDLPDDMVPSLDHATADRLLSGRIQPDDAPPGYSAVASLLLAVSESRQPVTPAMEKMTIEQMASAIAALPPDPPARGKSSSKVRSRFVRARVIGAVAFSTVIGTAGLAMAGALPGSAQGVASSMLAKIGVSAPHPDATGNGQHISSGDNTTTGNGSGKGSLISGIAHETTGNKGPTVCQAASEGKCQAGLHGHEGEQGHGGQQSHDPDQVKPAGGGGGGNDNSNSDAGGNGGGSGDGVSSNNGGNGGGNGGGNSGTSDHVSSGRGEGSGNSANHP